MLGFSKKEVRTKKKTHSDVTSALNWKSQWQKVEMKREDIYESKWPHFQITNVFKGFNDSIADNIVSMDFYIFEHTFLATEHPH